MGVWVTCGHIVLWLLGHTGLAGPDIRLQKRTLPLEGSKLASSSKTRSRDPTAVGVARLSLEPCPSSFRFMPGEHCPFSGEPGLKVQASEMQFL